MSLKKKKKKKKEAPVVEEKVEESEQLSLKQKEIPLLGLDDFLLKGKKKKRKGKMTFDEDNELNNKNLADAKEDSNPWIDSTRDYTYIELLHRAKELLHQRNPELDPGKLKPVICPAPEVNRISIKRTSFVNFLKICKALHRQPEHLQAFMTHELGSPSSLEQTLIIKGKFVQKQIENVMRRYIKEYVTCHSCRSSNTILTKQDRIYNLSCETCQATCSVSAIQKSVAIIKKN